MIWSIGVRRGLPQLSFAVAATALLSGSLIAQPVSAIPGRIGDAAPAAPNLDSPAVVTDSTGSLELFTGGATTTRHNRGTVVEHRTRSASGWSPARSLGGVLHSAPAAASTGPGTVAVFGTGSSGAVYEKRFTGRGWSGWTSLGGRSTGRPAAASPGPAQLAVFAAGPDGKVWTRSAPGGGKPQAWVSLGGQPTLGSGPAAVSTAGTVTVAVRWSDDTIRSRTAVAGSWGPWINLGGQTFSDPAVASAAPGRIDVYVRGRDDALWHRTTDSRWKSLGGQLGAGPAASAPAEGGLVAVVARSRAGMYYSGTQAVSGSWSGWSKIPAITGPSWNPHVQCWARLTTLGELLGRETKRSGGATFAGGGFAPGIPAKNTAVPPCAVNGVWEYVEIHDLRVRLAFSDGLTGDGDKVGWLADPTRPLGHLTQVHGEIAQAFTARAWGPRSPPNDTLIDVQGFVYWDPEHVREEWHSYTGWELHPLTAWRLAR